MLTLNDGRDELWQWDTGRKLTVDADCSQVHFSNKVFGRSIDVDVIDGVAAIPDILLQTDKELTAWAFVGTSENGYTKISKIFKVNKRNKPSDYVFTPTDQTTLGEILDRIEELENRPGGDVSEEDIQNAVNDYLDKNPISVEEKDPTVPAWAKQPEKPKYTAEEVGALPESTKIPAEYKLPVASADTLGGIKAEPATEADTQPVRIGEDGMMFTVPGGGGEKWETIVDYTVPEDCVQVFLKTDINGNPFKLKKAIAAMIIHPTEDVEKSWAVRYTVDGTVDNVYNAAHYAHGTCNAPSAAGKCSYARIEVVKTPIGVWLRRHTAATDLSYNENGYAGGREASINEDINLSTLHSNVTEISAIGIGSFVKCIGKGTRIVMVGVRE